MELKDALSQIATIHDQLAQTETFRGYRSLTVAFSGGLAFLAAAVQTVWLPEPHFDIDAYVELWGIVAILSLATVSIELIIRCWRDKSPLTTRGTVVAIGHFLPSVISGGLLTVVLMYRATECLWLLPGLWSILFGLGVFSSSRLLPSEVAWVGAYYVVAGTAWIGLAGEPTAFSPWFMIGSFGIGQMAVAAILYFKLERNLEPF